MDTQSLHAVTIAQEIFWLNFPTQWTFHLGKNFLWKGSRKAFHRRFLSVPAVERHEVERCCPSLEPFHSAFSWNFYFLEEIKTLKGGNPSSVFQPGVIMRARAEPPAWIENRAEPALELPVHISVISSFILLPHLGCYNWILWERRCEQMLCPRRAQFLLVAWAGLLWGRSWACCHFSHTDVASSWLSECQTGQGCQEQIKNHQSCTKNIM